MKNAKARFVCSRCGAETFRWAGSKTLQPCIRATCDGVQRRADTLAMRQDAKAKAELAQFYTEAQL